MSADAVALVEQARAIERPVPVPNRPGVFGLELGGESKEVTQAQLDAIRAGFTREMRRGLNRANVVIEGGVYGHRDMIGVHEDQFIVSRISDTIGGVTLPELSIWDPAYQALWRAQADLKASQLSSAAQDVTEAQLHAQAAMAQFIAYREGTITGASRAQTGLEWTRDISFAVAGIMATVATGGAGGVLISTAIGATGTAAQQAMEVHLDMRREIDWRSIGVDAAIGIIVGLLGGAIAERLMKNPAWTAFGKPMLGRIVQNLLLGRGQSIVQTTFRAVVDNLAGEKGAMTGEQLVQTLAHQMTDPKSLFMDMLNGEMAQRVAPMAAAKKAADQRRAAERKQQQAPPPVQELAPPVQEQTPPTQEQAPPVQEQAPAGDPPATDPVVVPVQEPVVATTSEPPPPAVTEPVASVPETPAPPAVAAAEPVAAVTEPAAPVPEIPTTAPTSEVAPPPTQATVPPTPAPAPAPAAATPQRVLEQQAVVARREARVQEAATASTGATQRSTKATADLTAQQKRAADAQQALSDATAKHADLAQKAKDAAEGSKMPVINERSKALQERRAAERAHLEAQKELNRAQQELTEATAAAAYEKDQLKKRQDELEVSKQHLDRVEQSAANPEEAPRMGPGATTIDPTKRRPNLSDYPEVKAPAPGDPNSPVRIFQMEVPSKLRAAHDAMVKRLKGADQKTASEVGHEYEQLISQELTGSDDGLRFRTQDADKLRISDVGAHEVTVEREISAGKLDQLWRDMQTKDPGATQGSARIQLTVPKLSPKSALDLAHMAAIFEHLTGRKPFILVRETAP